MIFRDSAFSASRGTCRDHMGLLFAISPVNVENAIDAGNDPEHGGPGNTTPRPGPSTWRDPRR